MRGVSEIAGFALRNWQSLLAGALAFLLVIRTDQRDDARAALATEQAHSAQFAVQVSAAARGFQAQFQSAARDVERRQTEITQEVSRDYQDRITQLRRRYDGLVRGAQDRARSGAAGRPAGLPTPGGPAGGPDGAAAAAARIEFDFNCRANSIQLEALQEWVRRQAAVPPATVPSSLAQ